MDAASLSGASLDRSTPARLWKSRRLSVKWILLVLAFPTTLLLWSGSLATVLRPMPPQYQPADLVRVFEWLQANAPVDSVALAAYNTSNPLPAWAPLRMVIGHRPENAHWEQVIPRVEAFYQTTTSDETRRALLKEFGVKYVIWGPNERLYGDWLPEGVAYLRLVYQSGVYQLYEVNPAP